MPQQITKLSEQEFSSLSSLNDRYAKLYTEIGQQTIKKEYYKKVLKDAEDNLNLLLEDFDKLEVDQETLASELTQKYGQGVVDLTEGTISVEV
jgi:hypothetical protein